MERPARCCFLGAVAALVVACCLTGASAREAERKAIWHQDQIWPWSLLPGGEAQWMPVTATYSCVALVTQLPLDAVERIIRYDRQFGWWQLGQRTGADRSLGVELDTAAAREALPDLKDGHHPVTLLVGYQNNFANDGMVFSFSELQYVVPFVTNRQAGDRHGIPELNNVSWTYRITAMEDDYIVCVFSWSMFRIPCTFLERSSYNPPLRPGGAFFGRDTKALPEGNISIRMRESLLAGPHWINLLAQVWPGRRESYEEVRQKLNFNVLSVLEQPWFSDPLLDKWGAYLFDLEQSSFQIIPTNELWVDAMVTKVLPEFRDSQQGLNENLLLAAVAHMPFIETPAMSGKDLRLLRDIRDLRSRQTLAQQAAEVRKAADAPKPPRTAKMLKTKVAAAPRAVSDGPTWGCGLAGPIPGIHEDGTVEPETQRLIDGLKNSSSFHKVSYSNWNFAPTAGQPLSSDFIFMPQHWGQGPVDEMALRPAGTVGFEDLSGKWSKAEMAGILLGSNEPDVAGSCVGDMFGKCLAPCTEADISAGECPVAHLGVELPPAEPNPYGRCNCWQYAYPTSVGFWPFPGCTGAQPLPGLWDNQEEQACLGAVMAAWNTTARRAAAKGYKYLSTPFVARSMDWVESFIAAACGCASGECACTDASCGCPVYVGLHAYGHNCQPEANGDYAELQQRLQRVAKIMEKYPFIQGAILNEVGMKIEGALQRSSGGHPAMMSVDHGCPSSEGLPHGLATFVERLLELVTEARAGDGRAVVKAFSWSQQDITGGAHDLRLIGEDGTLNHVGEAYIRACNKWAAASSYFH